VQKKVREGVGINWGARRGTKKQKAGSWDKLGSRRGTKTKGREFGKLGSLQVCY
jgi:hypothetical protein